MTQLMVITTQRRGSKIGPEITRQIKTNDSVYQPSLDALAEIILENMRRDGFLPEKEVICG